MRRSKQENADVQPRFGDMGDLWHALTRLRAAHPEPVGSLIPFESPEALLSVTHPYDMLFTARVEMSGAETMGHVHDLLHTVTRGIAIDTQDIDESGFALEVRISKRHELALHTGHVDGLTRLLLHALGTIGALSSPGGGRCFHCDGTGLAHPLWEPAAGHG
ncbi:hypothetical protein [Streptomyces misionensis]|uniref:hypothetical protein n=1 Tax=Streptomyces misionensis TaxID=67331 RepID=UPI0033B36F68